MIKAKNLTKTYSQGKNIIRAVKGINLNIERGEHVCIIGPSGAGKSTLLHLLGALDKPTGGTVFFENENLYKINEKKRTLLRNKKIGFVFQFYHLLPDFTALENVLMPSLIGRGIRHEACDMRKRATALLGRMDLSHRLDHKPRELSGGEAQRVAIARAIINEPDILFCDEPTGNLDSSMGEQIYDIIFEMAKEKSMTLALVTHQERYVSRFNKVYYIQDGRLTQKEKTWV